jgi:hypothetical protein
MIPNTYNGLLEAIAALAEDDSQEFSNYIPTAIYLAEENLLKKMDAQWLTATASVVATQGVNTLTKPSGFLVLKDIHYKTSGNSLIQPTMKTNGFVRDYWPVLTSSSSYPNGQPKYFANETDTSWLLAPTPASAYTFTVLYEKQLTHLSALNQTNDYATLSHSKPRS